MSSDHKNSVLKNSVLIRFAFLLLVLLLTASGVQAQTLTYDSSIHHDFASPHAAVTARQSLASGWTDQKGGVYTITKEVLQATSAKTTGYFDSLALRPASENSATPDVGGTIFVPNGIPSPGTANGLVLRFQPDSTFYLFQISSDTLYAYKISRGTAVVLMGAASVHPDTAHSYSLTGSAVTSAGNVALSVSARDMQTHQLIGSLRVFDHSSPILSAGRVGIDSWVGNNAEGTVTMSYSRVRFYRLPAVSATDLLLPTTSKTFPKIGFIGDSITSGYNQVGSTVSPGVNDAATLTIMMLSKTKGAALADAGIAWADYDQGVSGSSSADWRPGNLDSPEVRAKAAFTSTFGKPDPKTNPVWVLVMLGTNDVRSDNRLTARQHQNNLQAITDDLVAGGFNVVINHAPAFATPTNFNGITWDASSLRLLQSYLPEEQAVVESFAARAPGRVFLGDTSAFDYFATRPELFQEYSVHGGLHPNGKGGTDALATFWARAFRQVAENH